MAMFERNLINGAKAKVVSNLFVWEKYWIIKSKNELYISSQNAI